MKIQKLVSFVLNFYKWQKGNSLFMAMITPTEKSMKCYSRHKNHLYAETEDAFLDIVAG